MDYYHFNFGILYDFLENKDMYPPLNPGQLSKLRHLSLATYAMSKRVCPLRLSGFHRILNLYFFSQILPYAFLKSALDLASMRELEDVIIDAIYMDIIRGKLDQQKQEFQVEWVMGRDLSPGAIESILKGLQEW